MSDAKTRHDLFRFLSNEWDEERAAQMIDLLPPAGLPELVTRDHLHAELSDLRGQLLGEISHARLASSREARHVVLATVAMWISVLVAIVVT